jgi:nickel-dependent lactate racemase
MKKVLKLAKKPVSSLSRINMIFVIVTPGGRPRDIDLHQSQKALSIAELVVDKGGVIVLVAECSDGAGKFTEWLKKARSPKEVIERFTYEGFTPEHSSKAFMCARVLEEYTVIISCSGIEKNELEQMFFHSSLSPQAAIDEALEIKGSESRVLVLPYAGSCIPNVRG